MPGASVPAALEANLVVEKGASSLSGPFQPTEISDASLSQELVTLLSVKCKMLTGGRCWDVLFVEESLLREGRYAHRQIYSNEFVSPPLYSTFH